MTIHTTAASALHAHIGGTQTEVARRLGEHQPAWGRYIRGDVQPRAERVRRWATVLGVALFVDVDGWRVAS